MRILTSPRTKSKQNLNHSQRQRKVQRNTQHKARRLTQAKTVQKVQLQHARSKTPRPKLQLKARSSHLKTQSPRPQPRPKALNLITMESDAGQRLDNFLLKKLKGVPKSLIYRLVRQKKITVNRRASSCDARLTPNLIVEVCPIRCATSAAPRKVPKALQDLLVSSILKETSDYIIINKPSGLATHGGSGVNFGVIEILRSLKPAFSELKLAHRLDQDTSGCLLIAKKRAVISAFTQQPSHKTYLLLVKGVFLPKKQLVNLPLQKNILKSGERMVVVAKDETSGKSALTEFRLVSQFSDCALVKATLQTGRTHQIRVHAAAINHPIAGDTKYGDKAFNAAMKARGLKRLFLHADTLKFKISSALVAVSAPLPKDLATLLDSLS